MFEITIIFAIIALTRKILLPEPKSEPLYLVGTAALVVDLAVGCYTEFRTARSPDPAS